MAITKAQSLDYIQQHHQGRLYPKRWELCNWKERSVRIAQGAATIGLHAAIAAAAVGVCAAAYYTIPVVVTPMSFLTLAAGFTTTYLFDKPPASVKKLGQELPYTKLIRAASNYGVLSIAAGYLGYYPFIVGSLLAKLDYSHLASKDFELFQKWQTGQ